MRPRASVTGRPGETNTSSLHRAKLSHPSDAFSLQPNNLASLGTTDPKISLPEVGQPMVPVEVREGKKACFLVPRSVLFIYYMHQCSVFHFK